MGCDIEFTSGVLRGGKDYKKIGDPYEYSASVLILSGKKLVVQGMAGKITPDIRNDIRNLLKTLGLKEIVWERYKNAKLPPKRYGHS